ncbi:immunoglobulin domain-containing protein oig-4-like [Planococcus citri]|uniref:immunoglobulin domain-containing protein oig-4-like n=1 Tax=Planococcus citri TaxID=170843 RepID=UPI0031FA2A37
MDLCLGKWIPIVILLLTFSYNVNAARGGRRGGSKKSGSRAGSRMQIFIPRNQDGASYYDNTNGARIIKSSHFEMDYMLGRKVTFFCMAQGIPRPHITWFKDGVELYFHKCFQVHEWAIGNDTLKSKMEIDPTTQKDAGYYECQADNQYALDKRGFRTDYVVFTL